MKGEKVVYYCEECGEPVLYGEYIDNHNSMAGDFIEGAGVCSGSCERELCAECAEWSDEGVCKNCAKEAGND